MSNFDLSMSNFLVPGLRNYQPKVGKMKSPGVSLTTLEVVNNMATPYTRVFIMTDGDTVSGPVEADCTVIYRTTASQQLDLTSLKGSPGVKINFILEGTGSLELALSSGVQRTTHTLTPQASIAQVYPLNSGGMQSGWVAFLSGNGLTQLETKLDEEITARTQADTALGTRIDTEVGTLSSLTTTAKDNLVAAVNEVQTEVNGKQDSLVTKTYNMPTPSTAGTRYIKIATCPWSTVTTIRCALSGVNFEDDIFINICGGVSMYADSCGWYTTNGRKTQAVIIKRGATFDASFEVWLKVWQQSSLTVTLYVEKQYSGILNTDTHLNITADKPSGSIAEHSLMANYSGFFGTFANDNTYRYTYVVDSNEKLTAWANNDKSGGQDYTSVLIRKGTWTSSKGVNLTAAGTKVVVGEPGSKLVFNNVEKGLYYDTAPTEPDYYMRGVTVTVGTGSSNGTGIGFHSCTNLTNCTGTGTGNGTGIGFHSCTNLTNCTGTGTGNGTGIGFHSCTNLTNCTGTGTGNGNGYGFDSCTNLTNCTGTGTGNGQCSGFYSCTNLTNCTGTGTGTVYGNGYGFDSCTNLTNCTGTGTGSGSDNGFGYGFYSCTNLTNCTGSGTGTGYGTGYGFDSCTHLTNCTGTGTGSGTRAGFGFDSCNVVIGCKAGEHCTTEVFQDCYASSSKTSTYACADTANGGFNNTTNPAA